MGSDFERHQAADQVRRLLMAGFTNGQARMIAAVTDESVERAKADLRRDFALWYAYWAIYVLIQVSIALLALVFANSSEKRITRRSIDLGSRRETGGRCGVLPGYKRSDAGRIQLCLPIRMIDEAQSPSLGYEGLTPSARYTIYQPRCKV